MKLLREKREREREREREEEERERAEGAMAAVEDSGSGSDELSQLRIYLERESGFDPLITHGIVEAIVTAETREEAEEIALIYLEGDEKALGLVRAYLNQGDASSKSTGEANVTTETHALHPGDNNPPGNFESYNQASTVGEVLAPPGFGSPIQQLPEYNNNSVAEDVSESTPRDEEDPVERTNNAKGRGKGKQRGKGKKIRTSDLDVLEKVPVPGRHVCECQATRHELIANCLSCGRIVCSQEGEGPCTFCGTIVSQDKDTRYKALLENVKGIKERRENVVEAAISEKERLVGYDKSSSKQTRVIDDQSDFFQIGKFLFWLCQKLSLLCSFY